MHAVNDNLGIEPDAVPDRKSDFAGGSQSNREASLADTVVSQKQGQKTQLPS
jgi:hypothetical protein